MSKKHAIVISPEVLGVLQQSTITPAGMSLPGQLDRDLYNRVAKPIGLLGLKWDRKLGKHVFAEEDGYNRLMAAMSGEVVIDTKKALQQYFTPPELAKKAALALCGGDLSGATVLEPSAGQGALALAARELGGEVTCVEIDPACSKKLAELKFPVLGGDFLMLDAALAAYDKFDFVLMNPPFTAGQDVKHVMAAHAHLKRWGRLVAIVSPSFQFRETALHSEFKDFFERFEGRVLEEIPAGTFSQAGTEVRTALIQIDK